MTIYTADQLENMIIDQLLDIARERNIVGLNLGKKRKDFIIDVILDRQMEWEAAQDPENNAPVEPPVSATTANAVQFSGFAVRTNPEAATGQQITSTIRVSSGASAQSFPVVGKTVGAVKELLREVLNIDRMANGNINGVKVDDSYVIKNGDVLEYIKKAGEKG